MRRIAPLIAGALAVLGPIVSASGQATNPPPNPNPGQARTQAQAQAQAPAPVQAQTPTPAPTPNGAAGRDASYDPAVQRASSPQAPTQSPGQSPSPSPGEAPAPAPARPPADDPELDAVLTRWEQTSGRIETLYATFEQTDEMKIVGETKKYKGVAYLRRPNLVVLNLEQETGDEGQEKFTFKSRILANGDKVIEFDGPTRQITIFPLPKDAQERAMEEGPLPFLFRMNILDFKRRYSASLARPLEEGTHRIVIRPKLAADRDAFSVAVLILDAQTLQPKSIHTQAANGQDVQNYTITALKANVDIKPELFAWDNAKAQQAQKDGWRIVENPAPGAEVVPTSPTGEIGRQELEPIPR